MADPMQNNYIEPPMRSDARVPLGEPEQEHQQHQQETQLPQVHQQQSSQQQPQEQQLYQPQGQQLQQPQEQQLHQPQEQQPPQSYHQQLVDPSQLEKQEKLGSSDDDSATSPERSDESDSSTPIRWTLSRIVSFIALCLVYSGSQLILYFTAGALTYIQIAVNTRYPNWILTANTLSAAATLPFVGYITDLFGRRWACILGAVLLVVSPAVIATAKTFPVALVGQALGGCGTGVTELTALAGVAEITPVKYRGVALAVVNLSLLPFMPYLIYIIELQEVASWRWAFLIVGVWNLLGLVGIFLCYKPPPRHNTDGLSRGEILKSIDYIGALLSFGGVTLFLVGLQAGGYQFAWTDPKVLAPLLVGGVMVLLFPLWEWKGPRRPMVPFAIFRGQRVVGLSFVIAFIGGMQFFSLLGFCTCTRSSMVYMALGLTHALVPVMLQRLYLSSTLTVGIRSLAVPVGVYCGGVVTNVLLSYTQGHVRPMFFTAAVLMTAFTGALAVATPSNPELTVGLAAVAAFGVGAFLIPALALSLYASPDAYIGTTAALALTVRFLGGSVGTAIYYNILNEKITALTPVYVANAVIPLGFPPTALPALLGIFSIPTANPEEAVLAALQAVLQFVPDQATALRIVQTAGLQSQLALAKSLSYVWYTTIAFGVCCIVASLLLPNIRKFMTTRVAVNLL